MDMWTSIGIAIGAVALLLTAVALRMSAPTFTVLDEPEGRFTLWHTGPGSIVIRKAYVRDVAGEHAIGAPSSGAEMAMGDGALEFPLPDDPFAKRLVVAPHVRFSGFCNVNGYLVIEYRAKGILGLLARAALEWDEGP